MKAQRTTRGATQTPKHRQEPTQESPSNNSTVEEGCDVNASIFEAVEVRWKPCGSLQLTGTPVKDRLDLDDGSLGAPGDRDNFSHSAATA
jgi:hypothetical protein